MAFATCANGQLRRRQTFAPWGNAAESVPYVAGWGETGALNAVNEYGTIDRLARRIEDALAS